MSEHGTLHLRTVEGDGLRFEATFPNGSLVMDGSRESGTPSPVQALLASIAACEGMDVISLLRKKRQQVTAYEVEMSGERATEHPRRFTAIEFVHRITGHGVQPAAVDDALRLTLEKYCSVYHSIRPDVAFSHHSEILEG